VSVPAPVAVTGRVALPAATVRRVVRDVLRGERAAAAIAVNFLGPARMRDLNRRFKGYDRPTDVLAFALPQPDGSLVGDVYVCRAVALAHAAAHGVPLREELIRLIVHGTLHVLGHDHPENAARERSPMWRRQERYVERLA
jgi:probable rRNA maturation factor